MRVWGSADAVIAALRDDAAAERERLERESAAAIRALGQSVAPQDAGSAAESTERLDRVRRALADADAAQEWDDAVAAASDRDAWIAEVASLGRRAIASAPDQCRLLQRLVREAVRELPGPDCVVAVPHALADAVERWRAEVERDTGKRIAVETGAFAAGCVARTPDGRVTFDNTIEARERRANTAWRTAVAHVYDEAIAARGLPVETA
jgi:hypothetical protein